LNQPLPIYGRINPLVAKSTGEVIGMLEDTGLRAEDLPMYGRHMIRIDAPAHLIVRNPCFLSGGFTIQDISAQIVARFVGARPNMTVVDFCSAPGGKTCAIAADMKLEGRLIGCDTSAKRMGRLEENVLRLGTAEFVEMLHLDDDEITIEEWVGPDGADRVLVDAPCSGLGTIRRHPEIRWRRSGSDLRRLPELQLEILERAAELVAPGGCVVYGTCSFAPEENEQVVERFLERQDGKFVIVPAKEGNAPDSVYPGELSEDGWLRFPPHSVECDSATAVRLRRLRR
ncbi:MAG: RsmB/NOP family class I SAM-dependent RNA methyltransferase, partial [Candidatus Sumerlaeota bacterium]